MAKRTEDAPRDLPPLKRLIQASDFDLVVAVSPEIVLKTNDVLVSTQIDICDWLALVVWDGDRDPVFVLCMVEEGFVRQESWFTDIGSFTEFVTSPVGLLARVIEELGFARGHVGLEFDRLAASYYEHLRLRLPNVRSGVCEPIFDRARMVKTPSEHGLLANGFRATERALKEALELTRGHTDQAGPYRA